MLENELKNPTSEIQPPLAEAHFLVNARYLCDIIVFGFRVSMPTLTDKTDYTAIYEKLKSFNLPHPPLDRILNFYENISDLMQEVSFEDSVPLV